jgi:hypothetical protein
MQMKIDITGNAQECLSGIAQLLARMIEAPVEHSRLLAGETICWAVSSKEARWLGSVEFKATKQDHDRVEALRKEYGALAKTILEGLPEEGD